MSAIVVAGVLAACLIWRWNTARRLSAHNSVVPLLVALAATGPLVLLTSVPARLATAGGESSTGEFSVVAESAQFVAQLGWIVSLVCTAIVVTTWVRERRLNQGEAITKTIARRRSDTVEVTAGLAIFVVSAYFTLHLPVVALLAGVIAVFFGYAFAARLAIERVGLRSGAGARWTRLVGGGFLALVAFIAGAVDLVSHFGSEGLNQDLLQPTAITAAALLAVVCCILAGIRNRGACPDAA